MAYEPCNIQIRRIHDTVVDSMTVLGCSTALQRLQSLLQKAQLRRVSDLSAKEQVANHDLRRLELVHVLEDEDAHLSRPRRQIGRGSVFLHRRCISQCE